jgi:hypothetical protein
MFLRPRVKKLFIPSTAILGTFRDFRAFFGRPLISWGEGIGDFFGIDFFATFSFFENGPVRIRNRHFSDFRVKTA